MKKDDNTDLAIGLRGEQIAKKILLNRISIKDVAAEFGIAAPSARQALHNFCRKSNHSIYDSLMHTGGRFSAKYPPRLKLLLINSNAFFEKKPRIDTSGSIKQLCLSVRAYNGLRCNSINTISDLLTASKNDLLKMPGIGRSCTKEIIEKIVFFGLSSD